MTDHVILILQLILPIALGVLIFASKSWIEKIIESKTAPIITTLTEHNGGSSVKDLLTFTLQAVQDGNARMDAHLENHAQATPKARTRNLKSAK
jgi:hypothetical protein